MIYESPSTLMTYRGRGRCEACGTYCKRREPHHIRCRGMKSGSVLDLSINLLSLGNAFECPCHRGYHDRNKPSRLDFETIVAKREGTTPEAIRRVVNLVLQIPKEEACFDHLEAFAKSLHDLEAERLAGRVFLEMGLDWRRTA